MNGGNGKPVALLGGFDGVGFQPCRIDARNVGTACEHRQKCRNAKLGGLLGEDLDALDRREGDPDIGLVYLHARLPHRCETHALLGRHFDARLPLAVAAVE